MQDKLERMQKEIDLMAGDLRGLKDYAVEIDKRVARIEGVMEGVARASAKPPRRLPRK